MSNYLLNALSTFFVLALSAITIQNTVLARSFGVSRLISLIDDTTNALIFGTLLTAVNVLSGIFNYLVGNYITLLLQKNFEQWIPRVRPLVMIACMAVAFFIVFVLTVKFAPYEYVAKAASALPVATFNVTVIGTLLISTTMQLTLLQVIAFGLGSSIGFVLAVLLVSEGQHKLQNKEMPSAFKGLPATLLFLAGLALAVYGLAGVSYTF